MNTTFMITGGAGRVISAIPALENFHTLNPDNDFKVIADWSELYHHHPLLHDRTINHDDQPLFEPHVLNNFLVSPEPYHLYDYYHNHVSLCQAFDIEINGTATQSSYKPNLYVSPDEDGHSLLILEEIKCMAAKDKVIVIQPFGSSSCYNPWYKNILDDTGRGITGRCFDKIVDRLSNHVALLFFGPPELWKQTNKKTFNIFPNNPSLRDYTSLIANCDYFVGCDSVGQHIARSLDKPGLVLMGGTIESNVSYPDYSKFKFYRKPNTAPTYNPLRFSPYDNSCADQNNKSLTDFTEEDIDSIVQLILESLDARQ